MQKIVYKYPISFGMSRITTGGNAKPVKFAIQHGVVTVWIQHDLDGVVSELDFIVVGTGQSIPSEYEHVESVLDGDYVWHLYCRHGI